MSIHLSIYMLWHQAHSNLVLSFFLSFSKGRAGTTLGKKSVCFGRREESQVLFESALSLIPLYWRCLPLFIWTTRPVGTMARLRFFPSSLSLFGLVALGVGKRDGRKRKNGVLSLSLSLVPPRPLVVVSDSCLPACLHHG